MVRRHATRRFSHAQTDHRHGCPCLSFFDGIRSIDGQGRGLCHDHGACTPYGVALAYNAGTNVIGAYVLPAFRLDINWCLTNFVPCAPTRGAGLA